MWAFQSRQRPHKGGLQEVHTCIEKKYVGPCHRSRIIASSHNLVSLALPRSLRLLVTSICFLEASIHAWVFAGEYHFRWNECPITTFEQQDDQQNFTIKYDNRPSITLRLRVKRGSADLSLGRVIVRSKHLNSVAGAVQIAQ